MSGIELSEGDIELIKARVYEELFGEEYPGRREKLLAYEEKKENLEAVEKLSEHEALIDYTSFEEEVRAEQAKRDEIDRLLGIKR
jgi:hypothetical protein